MVAGAPRRAALAAALGLLSGCVVMSASVSTGALLPDGELARLRDGATTRAQILEAFGPPRRLAHRGAGGEAELLEPFGAIPPSPDDVAYRYRASRGKTTISELGLLKEMVAEQTTQESGSDDLWLLLDGRSGRLRAHVHRRLVSPGPDRHGVPAQGGAP